VPVEQVGDEPLDVELGHLVGFLDLTVQPVVKARTLSK
jgi:hypothetical protein